MEGRKKVKGDMASSQQGKPLSGPLGKGGYAVLLMLFLLMTFFSQIGTAQSGEDMRVFLLYPIQDASVQSKAVPATAKEVYEVRKGAVSINSKVFDQAPQGDMSSSNIYNGSRFQLSFFADRTYDVIIDKVSKMGDNTILLSGKVIDTDLSTFTLTLTRDSYIINLQDLSGSILYRVVGNSQTGIGEVTEIDQRKIPPMRHLPPIVPPTSE